MSYLAMSAEPINNDNNQSYSTDNTVNKKRQHHNKTQKYRQNTNEFNSQKVNSVLQTIHNNISDDDEFPNYGPASAKHSDNFKPLNPYTVANEKKEPMTTMHSGDAPQPVDNDELNLQELQSAYMNDAQVRDYYRKLTPSYNSNNSNNNNNSNIAYNIAHSNTNANAYNNKINLSSANLGDTNQVLIEKLNYMINLLEEQQDQKTESVTEEVVLYSFLGVFIIFIVDSFSKVGKYVR